MIVMAYFRSLCVDHCSVGTLIDIHSVQWGINPPQKHTPFFFTMSPLNMQTAQALSVSEVD